MGLVAQGSSTAANGPASSASSLAASSPIASHPSNPSVYQSRSDSLHQQQQPLKSSGTLGSPYYTNDVSAFLPAASSPSASGKPESRSQLSSPSNGYSSMASSAASSPSAMGIPYQALLQALAASNSPSSSNSPMAMSSSNQIASIMSPNGVSSGGVGQNWALPASWASTLGSVGGAGGASSLLNMFSKPVVSQLTTGAGRRSSLTSRLRNFVNAIFYRYVLGFSFRFLLPYFSYLFSDVKQTRPTVQWALVLPTRTPSDRLLLVSAVAAVVAREATAAASARPRTSLALVRVLVSAIAGLLARSIVDSVMEARAAPFMEAFLPLRRFMAQPATTDLPL